jgi:hypothetical protein
MRVTCPACGVGLKLPPEFTGSKASCPKCKSLISIPSEPVAVAPSPPIRAKPPAMSPAPAPPRVVKRIPVTPHDDDPPPPPPRRKKKQRSPDSVPTELWIAMGLGVVLRLFATIYSLVDSDSATLSDPSKSSYRVGILLVATLVSILVWVGIYLQSNLCRQFMQAMCVLTLIAYVFATIGAFSLPEGPVVALFAIVISAGVEIAILALLAQDSVQRYTRN